MKIELTQKELVSIVRKHYNIESRVELEVALTDVVKPAEVKLSQPKPDDTKDFLSDLKPEKKRGRKPGRKKQHRSYTAPGEAVVEIPKNPKIDYMKYGQAIEDFYKSDQDFIVPHEDNTSGTALMFRYRIALELSGYRDKISLNLRRKDGVFIMSKKGKGPRNYTNSTKAYIK